MGGGKAKGRSHCADSMHYIILFTGQDKGWKTDIMRNTEGGYSKSSLLHRCLMSKCSFNKKIKGFKRSQTLV